MSGVTVEAGRRGYTAGHWLARLGGLFLILQLYIYGRWIFSDFFVATRPDPTRCRRRDSLGHASMFETSIGMLVRPHVNPNDRVGCSGNR